MSSNKTRIKYEAQQLQEGGTIDKSKKRTSIMNSSSDMINRHRVDHQTTRTGHVGITVEGAKQCELRLLSRDVSPW